MNKTMYLACICMLILTFGIMISERIVNLNDDLILLLYVLFLFIVSYRIIEISK